MLSQPYPIHQQHHHQYHNQDDLSSSLPLAQSQPSSTELLTSSFHPNPLDDLCLLDVDPLNDQSLDLFSLPSSNEGQSTVNLDSTFSNPSGMLISDDFPMASFSMPSVQPLLSSSLDGFSFQFNMSSSSIQHHHQQQQQQQKQHRPSDATESKGSLTTPSHRGHRRRRSSVPSCFHSVKKQIIQSSFVPPAFDANSNHNVAYLSQQAIPKYYQHQQHLSTTMQSIPLGAESSPSSISASIAAAAAAALVPQAPVFTHHQQQPQQQQCGKPLPIQIQRNPAFLHRHPSPASLDQQQLDKKLLEVDFNDITVAGLKDCLRERNLSVAGRKAELVDRLRTERQRVYSQQQQQQQQQQQRQGPTHTVRFQQDIPTITSSSSSIVASASSAAVSSPTSASTPSLSSAVVSPPSSPSMSSLSSSPSPHAFNRSSPTPVNQLAHRLGDLGFQPHPPSTTLMLSSSSSSDFSDYNQHPQRNNMSSQQHHLQLGSNTPIPHEFKLSLDGIQQQWNRDSYVPHFYQF
ncbi:unnamed protein product [Absidia cylindrospora]